LLIERQYSLITVAPTSGASVLLAVMLAAAKSSSSASYCAVST
jgi:hypothetical protein